MMYLRKFDSKGYGYCGTGAIVCKILYGVVFVLVGEKEKKVVFVCWSFDY